MYDDDISASKAIAALLALALVIGALTLVGWRVGWWFQQKNTDMQAHIYQHSYGANVGDISTIDNQINDYNNIKVELTQVPANSDTYNALEGQLLAIKNSTCDIIARMTVTLPSNISDFKSANC